jgi:hypothetical protein
MLKHFLHYFLFAFTMFAAAAPAVGGGDGGAGDGGGAGDRASGGDAGADLGLGDEGGAGDGAGSGEEGDLDSALDGTGEEGEGDGEQRQPVQQDKDPETADLKGLVSKRLIALKKEAPELTAVFQKYPKVQEQVEAAFRRDMAYRELYPTVAEARQMREQFPNGMADVEQLLTDVGEVEQLDKDFYERDPQGQYAGHNKIIQNMFQQDREAAVSLFRTLPKEWSRLDPDSYNDVMGAVVGATLMRAELPEWITELRDAAKAAKQDGIATSLDKMLRWATGFQKRKAEPTEEERRIQTQRADLDRTTAQRKQEDQTRFHQDFVAQSSRLQDSIIRKHPAVTEMLAVKGVTDAKKAEVIAKIRTAIQSHLKNSRAFMSKLRPAYNQGKLKETLDLQKAQWSYPWVLNKFVRQVMAQEMPNLVRNPGARRSAATAAQRQPAKGGQEREQRSNARTAPYKENGVWHKKDGSRFTTAEILRGLHLNA